MNDRQDQLYKNWSAWLKNLDKDVFSLHSQSKLFVSLRQNGVGHDKICADAILPKGHVKFQLCLALSRI